MNSILVFLLNVSLVITVSIILVEAKDNGKIRDQRFIKECKDELNLTNYRFTIADLKSIGIPTTLEQGCLLDCFHFKLGQIKKKNQTSFIEHVFVAQPPKSGTDLTRKSTTFVKKVADAEAACADYLTRHHIEECHLVYQHRHCVSKVLNGTQIPEKLSDDEE
ncbi:uncharacterized protein LOC135833267 isoform X2 [Planococcus citri]|uniref:uncharacterized protein LOC135833267 isoform X2 n=1 Tax=Planococcus citri TaxID=170843 RepID=UPI0031F778F4